MSTPSQDVFSKTIEAPILPPIPGGNFGQTCLLSLDGSWGFAQPVPASFPGEQVEPTSKFTVPGEVVMQGMPFKPQEDFVVERQIDVPASWKGQNVRLRFDAVYSSCEVFVNGKKAGAHMGGFTAFDLDVTDFVKAGATARISLQIRNNSIADDISWGTIYAGHALAGIPRKVRLYTLPNPHLRALSVATLFDNGDYSKATLQVEIGASAKIRADLQLVAPDGHSTGLGTHDVDANTTLNLNVAKPLLWDTEHPNLYVLEIKIDDLVYKRTVGFREFAIRNRQTELNGRRIFMRGINHHEIHPITGRADTAKLAEKDVELMRAAHLNTLRTSHYPPTPELAEACDRAGMLLEVEAPVCFSFGSFGKNATWDERPIEEQVAAHDYIMLSTAEMVVMFKSNPSVVVWSIANESVWSPPFEASSRLIKSMDATRPLTFNWAKYEDLCKEYAETANEHYPKSGDVYSYNRETRPILFGEFSHLYCYNDRELLTDPGLRSLWSGYLDRQWKEVLDLENGAGGSIWACIDDVFLIPENVSRSPAGYGPWGPIDGWRRPKPEFEGMQRVFDPVQIRNREFIVGSVIRIPIENRWDATDFSEGVVHWTFGDQAGSLQMSLAPNEAGEIELPIIPAKTGNLTLTFSWPHLNYDRAHRIRIVEADVAAEAIQHLAVVEMGEEWRAGDWRLKHIRSEIVVSHADRNLTFSPRPALIPRFHENRHLPLMIPPSDPIDNACADWRVSKVELIDDKLVVSGSSELVKGIISFGFSDDGAIDLSYDLSIRQDFEPWQTGMVFPLSSDHDALEWRRKNVVDDYSSDHLARSVGVTRAFRSDAWAQTGPEEAPSWPWSMDQTSRGTNDFRSTKYDILEAAITNPNGDGLKVLSNGDQHVRAFVENDEVHLNVFDYCGLGSETFLASFNPATDFKRGHKVSGSIRLASAIKTLTPNA